MVAYQVIGKPSRRWDGEDKVTGAAVYAGDVHLPGTLFGKSLHSPYPHARIVSIDTSAAEALPGVHAVITGEQIRTGGLATSGTTARRWAAGGEARHHIVDPRRGGPASEVWRTASVAGPTCVRANVASTAAIVRGRDAVTQLERVGLPARLVDADGGVLRLGGWPEPGA